MAEQIITQEYLQSIFEYRDGILYWKISPCPRVKTGDVAGSICSNRYYQVRVFGKRKNNHRLIFMMHHNYFPQIVDHIDGNILNNKIENLRAASIAENNWNSKISKNNTSGVKNVSWNKKKKSWVAYIRIGKDKKKFIGLFKDLDLARLAVEEARNKYHGEFARHL
jgi:hypothetical protein